MRMKFKLLAWTLGSLLCANVMAQERGSVTKPGLHENKSIAVDGHVGTARTLSYFVPRSLQGKPPLVIYLHGHGDNMRHIVGKGLVPSASAQWMEVAERESLLVFYPLGLDGSDRRSGWNDCRTDTDTNPKVDDISFVKALVEFAAESFNVDRQRIYVTGMSNGGQMTMRIAMEMSDQVAAAASISALMPQQSRCAPPAKTVPILLMHGTEDPIAPFNGGAMAGERGNVYSFRESTAMWRRFNKLEDAKGVVKNLPDIDLTDRSTLIEYSWTDLSGSAAVIAIEMHGAGHTEPSRAAKINRILARVQGNQNRDIEMADTVWAFFKQHTLTAQ